MQNDDGGQMAEPAVVMADPKPEMDCPVQNLRKSVWDQRVLEACESAISHSSLFKLWQPACIIHLLVQWRAGASSWGIC